MFVTFENVTVTVEADTTAAAYNALCAHLERFPTLTYSTDTYSATGIHSDDTGDLQSEARVPAPPHELTQGMFAPGQPDTLIAATITTEDVRNVAADHEWTITDEQAQAILERRSTRLIDAFLNDWTNIVNDVCRDDFAEMGVRRDKLSEVGTRHRGGLLRISRRSPHPPQHR